MPIIEADFEREAELQAWVSALIRSRLGIDVS